MSFVLLALQCMLVLTSINLARTQTSTNVLLGRGTITYGGIPIGLLLKYGTDFEDITKVDNDHLSLPISHWFEVRGGGTFWMEGLDRNSGVTPHSGNRCVGMEIAALAASGSTRNEFNIMPLNSLVGSKLFVSVWLYLPADWGLFSTGWNWYEIVCPQISPYISTYVPYWALHIVQPPQYRIDVDMRDLNNVLHTMAQTPLGSVVRDPPAYPLPRGRWFNIQYYVLRSSASGVSDGAVKVWIDGKIVCDLSGVVTSSGGDWGTCPADIYGSLVQSALPYRLWVDDLSIYGAS